jgi:hypothetical protein
VHACFFEWVASVNLFVIDVYILEGFEASYGIWVGG